MITRTILLLFAALLMPGMAFAANLFEPVPNDISLKILGSIFGGLMPSGFAGSDPIVESIKMFNGGVLIIGGILAAYTILAGTLGTAHDGEMLGKKFSSVWIPIRYSVGTALVLPVVGGGYCAMQAIVMWLVVQGVGLADNVYSAFMKSPILDKQVQATASGKHSPLVLAENLFSMFTCVHANNLVTKSLSARALGWDKKYVYGPTFVGNMILYGNTKEALQHNQCGTLILPAPPTTKVTKQTGHYVGVLGTIENTTVAVDFNPISDQHVTQAGLLLNKMDALAAAHIEEQMEVNGPAVYKQIQAAADEYKKAIDSTSQSLAASVDFSTSAEKYGWAMAGTFFTHTATVNSNLGAAVQGTPTSSASLTPGGSFWLKDSSPYMDMARVVLKSSRSNPADPITFVEDGKGSRMESASGLAGKITAEIGALVSTVNLYELKDDFRHANVVAVEMGNRLLALYATILAASMSIAGIAGFGALIGGGGVTAAATIFASFLTLPMAALLVVGGALSTVVPMLPYLIWFGALIGFVLLVFEAIIAAPLWAIMHLHPNGDDLTGKGGNGYMLVLSLLLRPVLMIFGFIAAILITKVMGEFLNKTFFEVLALNGGGEISGLSGMFTIIFGTFIYAVALLILNSKCFSLVHMIPDQLMRWIGGGQESLGQFAAPFDSNLKQGAEKGLAAGVAVGHIAGEAAKKGLKSGAAALQGKRGADGAIPDSPSGDGGDGGASPIERAAPNIMPNGGSDDTGSMGSNATTSGAEDTPSTFSNGQVLSGSNSGPKRVKRNVENSTKNYSRSIATNADGSHDKRAAAQVASQIEAAEKLIGIKPTQRIADRVLEESKGSRKQDFEKFQHFVKEKQNSINTRKSEISENQSKDRDEPGHQNSYPWD